MWPGTESNCRHEDFQSSALPTELPGHEVEILLKRLGESSFVGVFVPRVWSSQRIHG